MRLVCRRGVVQVEFLLVILPLLVFWFGLTQLGLLYAAQLLVEHAAARAARAAIVILPDIAYEGTDAALHTIGNGVDGTKEALRNYKVQGSGSRLGDIRRAAALTVGPILPALDEAVSGEAVSVAEALDGSLLGSMASALTVGTRTVAVTFPDGDEGYRGAFGPREPVTTRVTVLFRCAVPMVAPLMCRGVEGRALDELSTVISPGKLWALRRLGGSYTALRAERTLPNQGM